MNTCRRDTRVEAAQRPDNDFIIKASTNMTSREAASTACSIDSLTRIVQQRAGYRQASPRAEYNYKSSAEMKPRVLSQEKAVHLDLSPAQHSALGVVGAPTVCGSPHCPPCTPCSTLRNRES